MRRALAHARRGLGRTAPNPLVGSCVVTAEGVVAGDGAHERAGGPHAEINALDEAGQLARGATLYSTLEPCAHVGRTGPCTERIIAAGVRRVVAAMEDPHPLVRGRGFAALRAHGVEVVIGVEHEAAERLNRPFLTAVRYGRPFVVLKAATSLDGFLAERPLQRTPLTSAAALRHAQTVRASVDAVAIGSGTLLADDPLLTVREIYRARPLTRVVFDRELRTPPTARLLTTLESGPVIIVASEDAAVRHADRARGLTDAGAIVLPMGEAGIRPALGRLAERGIQSVVLEGGGIVHAAAWDEGVVDYLQVYVAPMIVKGTGPRLPESPGFSTAGLEDQRITVLGPDVLIEGYVHRSH